MAPGASDRYADELQQAFTTRFGIEPLPDQTVKFLLGFVDLYEERGLLKGLLDRPLWCSCEHAASCWHRLPDSYKPGWDPADVWRGGILLPWVGPHYADGGVVILGINLNGAAGGLFIEYDIALNGPKSQFGTLSRGRFKAHRSWWAYRSTRSAALALQSLLRQTPTDEADPRRLALALLATARLQSVKCSPNDGGRSSRTREMQANCPPQFLREELDVLSPGAILTFGREAWSAVQTVAPITATETGRYLTRATFTTGPECEVFALPHPSSVGNRWEEAHYELLASLLSRPLR